jgi:hypothetical protein
MAMRNFYGYRAVTCTAFKMLCPMYTLCTLINSLFDAVINVMKLHSQKLCRGANLQIKNCLRS